MHIDSLNTEMLKWVFSYDGFKNPRSLEVYSHSRTKKITNWNEMEY